MDPRNSYLKNCFICPKDGSDSSMFDITPEHGVQCCLDGYAIVPRDEYDRLRALGDDVAPVIDVAVHEAE